MFFRQVPRADTGCLAYVVGDEKAGECAIIDAPEASTALLAEAARAKLRVTHVIESHTHADHVSGTKALALRLGIRPTLPFLSHARFPHDILLDGRDVRVGDVRIRALHTPGHTPCSMTLVLDDRALVGDALLVGTAGRSDFYPEGPEEMYHSLFDRILKLDDRLLVYPAHYGPRHGLPERMMTTIGEERRVNEALSQRSKEAFIRYMTEGWPPKPKAWQEIVDANNAP